MRLRARGKRENKVIVALAREMCAFLWELQNKVLAGGVPATAS